MLVGGLTKVIIGSISLVGGLTCSPQQLSGDRLCVSACKEMCVERRKRVKEGRKWV